MSFRSFEEIQAWQEARLLMKLIRKCCKRANEKKDWNWANQTSSAGLSIMANIAEGCDAQTNPEFVQFLGYAKRSAAEVRSHLYHGLDEAYVSQSEFEEGSMRTKKIGAQLAKLIAYLQEHERPPTKNQLRSKQGTSNKEPRTLPTS